MASIVIFEDVRKVYNGVVAVNKLNLRVEKGELVVLIGPSGCGKTTSLKMVNRIIQPTSGKIYVNGTDSQQLDPVMLRRQIGYVIQNIGLFPHKTVADNIAIVPKLKKWSKQQTDKRVNELLNLVNMAPAHYRDRYPKELSGGQQQRIGVLRALAGEPEVILMDEPFGALDPITRDQLQNELKRIQQQLHKTIVFVTHDMGEALKIADRIVVMKDGEIVQAASPQKILREPANDFIRQFIGLEKLARTPEQVQLYEVMEKQIVTIDCNTGLSQALQVADVGSKDYLIVTRNNGALAGVIDVRDLRSNLLSLNNLNEVMREWPHLGATDSVKTAVKLMFDTKVPFVPVVDEGEQVMGVVTASSVYSYILDNSLESI